MSRFFQGNSSSEDESEGSSEDEKVKVPTKFAKDSDDEEEPELENVKRVAKSARDRRYEEFDVIHRKLTTAVKDNEWVTVVDEYERLNKQLDKSKALVASEGIPRIFIKVLAQLEDAVTAALEAKPKLNGPNSKSFNAIRQKLKKGNKQYESQIKNYRANPDVEKKDTSDAEDKEESEEEKQSDEEKEESEEEDANEDEDDEEGLVAAAKPKNKFFQSSSDDESGEEKSDDEKGGKWFQDTEAKAPTKKTDDKQKGAKKEKQKKDVAKEEKPTEMNEEQIREKLREISANRGRKSTDVNKQSAKLNELMPYAKTANIQVEILVHIASNHFDAAKNANTPLPVAAWKAALESIKKLLSILEANPSVNLTEETEVAATAVAPKEGEENDAEAEAPVQHVSGNLAAFVERLDDEYIKSLQNIDPHTKDYITRLQDEIPFMQISEQIQEYYERTGRFAGVARVAERRLEHVYYRLGAFRLEGINIADVKPKDPETTVQADSNGTDAAAPAEGENVVTKDVPLISKSIAVTVVNLDDSMRVEDTDALVEKLSHLVYKHGDERLKIRTMLCTIYYKALRDKFYEARDMMLMSHLQESIGHTDILTQILFNRTMVQLGLSAFRSGLIKQSHSCLSDICGGGKVKELLAQGTNTRYHDRDPKREKEERKRQLPYHMHINQDVLDAVHYVCAMLLEVPNMAANAFDIKRKVLSRPFRRLVDIYESNMFNGPPENTRDVIVAAAKALERGDWQKTIEYIFSLPVWNIIQNSVAVKEMLTRKIKEESLRTFLFSFNAHYESISIQELISMFDLPTSSIHSLVSKMMINEELHGSWDQPSGCIIMQQVEPTRLQFLALQLAEKAGALMENNEKLVDGKSGGYGYKDQKRGDSNRTNRPYKSNRGRENDSASSNTGRGGGNRSGNRGGSSRGGSNRGRGGDKDRTRNNDRRSTTGTRRS